MFRNKLQLFSIYPLIDDPGSAAGRTAAVDFETQACFIPYQKMQRVRSFDHKKLRGACSATGQWGT